MVDSSSSSAEDSSPQPQTPTLPSSQKGLSASDPANADPSPDNFAGGKKRKQNRRINTAERRATHNAVERQRRETLNGRFLDLAAILPNLSQIRRPSKSAIVNSSIAYFHASRRHRALASRELRLLKFETDALRRELNDWRDRASIRRVQEPTRSDGFSIVLSGEIEILPIDGLDNEDGEDGDDDLYTPTVSPDDNYDHPFDSPTAARNPPPGLPHDSYNMNPQYLMQRRMSNRGPVPMIASPNGMAMENPAAGFDPMGGPGPGVPESYPAFHEMNQSMQNKWSPMQDQQVYYGSASEREQIGHKPDLEDQTPQYFEQRWNNGNEMQNVELGGNMAGGARFGMM
ncbi:hypothetical protein EV361DRAFT_1031652 [Lentinula raphanica]|uniref:BHLH domain-containing protein n=1 Tax=Lentinula raphanica TaxID=153919 RepID=A0AA38ULT9_9AGAR|nr:hypothetical protein C8R42DRAFT_661817 [Lentinula raphanica]KAJ3777842.1 hypothetical protein FB446DRAFT_75627 [Lentinula raphanica]KAJ3845431.1 hypothetical protein F5878DRAFT_599153 [Lentinula raphanica]KAJ3974532.1 hypothetical protein EV361DRAFT_1031652 [Lentinula raphanica]